LVAGGSCRINERRAESGMRVKAGDLVQIEVTEDSPTSMTPEARALDIVFEDDEIIVLVKPAGTLAHPTIGVKEGTLANALAYHLNRERYQSCSGEFTIAAESLARPGIVHRLDRETSGLMVVAKTPRALRVLARHFRKRLVDKQYVALVQGEVPEESGVITGAIGRDPSRRPQWWVMESGKAAETRYRVLERVGGRSLLELEPVTGRTNQLRIHCAYSGHPIVGDRYYGLASSLPPAGRLFLHANRLAFNHPVSGERLVFSSSLPDELSSYLSRLRGPEEFLESPGS
jgi:23S rRNA pseudouridine1911/1915/1917 synthase